MTESSLSKRLLQVMADYEQEWQQHHQELLARIEALERENQDLRHQLEVSPSVFDEIQDEQLQARLTQLRNSPLDTMIREAGVVLENRLRMVSGVTDKHGVQLVDEVLAPQGGALRYSEQAGEQEGVRMLYRGAMQFIRNPPMHKLIEYPESTARLLIRLIDALLQLLAEGEAASRDDVTVGDVRRVLTRRRISKSQQLFYRVIYNAGEIGLSMSELAAAMDRTPGKIAGVLGALGLRISKTKGLEGKGGIQVILDITEGKNGEWLYKMRPVLRQALEAEDIV